MKSKPPRAKRKLVHAGYEVLSDYSGAPIFHRFSTLAVARGSKLQLRTWPAPIYKLWREELP
jgi:hypothetical protein